MLDSGLVAEALLEYAEEMGCNKYAFSFGVFTAMLTEEQWETVARMIGYEDTE